jgi:oxygen-independent coproporphyrinogen-3 oxidase
MSTAEILMDTTPSVSLLRKYNVPGPRYTSYPTVPYWSDSPTEAQWIDSIGRALDEGAEAGIGAALYIHIPFCISLCTYCGCNTRITRNYSVGMKYVESVIQEWKLYLSKLNRKIRVEEIHLGGGTPTFLKVEELEALIQGVLSQPEVIATHESKREFSLEADPRVTTKEQLQSLFNLGFRRLSLGIQDFDPEVQKIVNRVQSREQVLEVTQAAREMGYTGINYDLIYGLPLQKLESVRKTIEIIQEHRPDRIAFYGYAHVPWIKPGQRRFTEADLPAGDEKRALYELGRKMLEDVGYHEVGMDHFALETDTLWQAVKKKTLHRNFMGYTSKQVSPLIALGVSAIGDSWRAFAQNEKLLETYQMRVSQGEIPIFRGHVLTEEDQILRRHILNLMTKLDTEWSQDVSMTPFLSGVQEKLSELESDGLVDLSTGGCLITEQGRPFIRNICMAFDARLAKKAPNTQLFSSTI